MSQKKISSEKREEPVDQARPQVFTLEVVLIGGPITERFAAKNPSVSRTIKIRGDQTLEELHYAIFDAFGRDDEHMYQFQFGKKPMDRNGANYVTPFGFDPFDDNTAGCVDETTLDSLGLKVKRKFFYWFDFGDDWWHEIRVEAIDNKVATGKFPRVTKRVGKSPPQYAHYE